MEQEERGVTPEQFEAFYEAVPGVVRRSLQGGNDYGFLGLIVYPTGDTHGDGSPKLATQTLAVGWHKSLAAGLSALLLNSPDFSVEFVETHLTNVIKQKVDTRKGGSDDDRKNDKRTKI